MRAYRAGDDGSELVGVSESPETPRRSHLAELVASRHRAVRDAARWLVVNPNLTGELAGVSWLFEDLAAKLLEAVHVDDPELTRALSELTRAKDSAVRAKIAETDPRP